MYTRFSGKIQPQRVASTTQHAYKETSQGDLQWIPDPNVSYECLVLISLDPRVADKAGRLPLPSQALSVEYLDNGKRLLARVEGYKSSAFAAIKPGSVVKIKGDYVSGSPRGGKFGGEFIKVNAFQEVKTSDDVKAYYNQLVEIVKENEDRRLQGPQEEETTNRQPEVDDNKFNVG